MSRQKKTAVILIGFLPNPRFEKRIALEKELCDLHVVCWDRGNDMLLPPVEDGFRTHIFAVRAGNDPVKRMIPYLRFSRKARKQLKQLQPDLIHVQGLDMLRIAMRYRRRHPNTRVIYEVADLHRLLVDRQRNPIYKLIQRYLRRQDKKYGREIDLLISTSEQYISSYFSSFVPEDRRLVMPNVPNLDAFCDYRKKETGLPLTVGFIGGIRYKTQIKNLLYAAQACGMNVMLAGYESGDDEIGKLAADMPDVEWVGRFDFKSQIASLYGKCDLMYSVYDADMANVRVALPNKLYESVWCGVPLIVAKGTYLAQIVENWGVGVAVDHRGPQELEDVLREFQNNPALLEQMTEKCYGHRDICDLESYNRQLEKFLIEFV